MTARRSSSQPQVRVRRVYEAPSADDGTRVLVDRLWPRGLSKADAHIDAWPKDVTPSTELRRWFHGPDSDYAEFRRRYEAELHTEPAASALERLRELLGQGPATLLTAVKEPEHSHVPVLLEQLES
ncbi:DUF488 family protein [Streptomyces triticagri]|uniref:DUF488 family protein n=1 Tax=Streptomyces triticagri TaxID=2293568 RepID=A0A372LXT0_9ACTN|nr:DUF488 family protein [Streptomyces triticagri]RFU83200.1 DUF488 family protein [Streptomyces triticagri]